MRADIGFWLAIEARQQHDVRLRASWLAMTQSRYRDDSDAQVHGTDADRARAEAEFARRHPAALDPGRHDTASTAPDPAAQQEAAERTTSIQGALIGAGMPASLVTDALADDPVARRRVASAIRRDPAALAALAAIGVNA